MGFCYHFGKLHVSVSAVGDRSISCWDDDGIKRPLFTHCTGGADPNVGEDASADTTGDTLGGLGW